MLRTMILAGLLSAATGCLGTATVSGGGYYDATPDLVEVEPGVQVIVDYDEPIFYSDNYYWRNNGGTWYRSSYYNRGWVSAQPPTYVARINSPGRYRHYRPAGYQPGVRDHRGTNNNRGGGNYNPPPQGPTVRDHRDDGYRQPQPNYNNPPPQGPVVREHGGGNSPPPPPPQGPVVREHGGGNSPPPPPRREEPKGPVVREHR